MRLLKVHRRRHRGTSCVLVQHEDTLFDFDKQVLKKHTRKKFSIHTSNVAEVESRIQVRSCGMLSIFSEKAVFKILILDPAPIRYLQQPNIDFLTSMEKYQDENHMSKLK